jgi:surface polysaccharide O-acyltransferase-like enzyme
MPMPGFFKSLPGKAAVIISTIVIVVAILFVVWQKNKYHIVDKTLVTAISKKTNCLYTISYDSLLFYEVTGRGLTKDIHITPDTVIPYCNKSLRSSSLVSCFLYHEYSLKGYLPQPIYPPGGWHEFGQFYRAS